MDSGASTMSRNRQKQCQVGDVLNGDEVSTMYWLTLALEVFIL